MPLILPPETLNAISTILNVVFAGLTFILMFLAYRLLTKLIEIKSDGTTLSIDFLKVQQRVIYAFLFVALIVFGMDLWRVTYGNHLQKDIHTIVSAHPTGFSGLEKILVIVNDTEFKITKPASGRSEKILVPYMDTATTSIEVNLGPIAGLLNHNETQKRSDVNKAVAQPSL